MMMIQRDCDVLRNRSTIDQYAFDALLPANDTDPVTKAPAAAESFFTEREMQVFELVAVGFTAKEIGRRLEVSPRTIEQHIENIRQKMGARNRPHMVMLAIEMGMDWAEVPVRGSALARMTALPGALASSTIIPCP